MKVAEKEKKEKIRISFSGDEQRNITVHSTMQEKKGLFE